MVFTSTLAAGAVNGTLTWAYEKPALPSVAAQSVPPSSRMGRPQLDAPAGRMQTSTRSLVGTRLATRTIGPAAEGSAHPGFSGSSARDWMPATSWQPAMATRRAQHPP
jgi:hypothetical protein